MFGESEPSLIVNIEGEFDTEILQGLRLVRITRRRRDTPTIPVLAQARRRRQVGSMRRHREDYPLYARYQSG